MSPRIVWSNAMRTGNHFIDLQHQELIDLIHVLADCVDAAQPPEQIGAALRQLGLYVIFHFNTEENLMANSRINADHARRHMQAHRAFAQKVEALQQADIATVQLPDLLDFLTHWLTEHILQTDQELALLLRS